METPCVVCTEFDVAAAVASLAAPSAEPAVVPSAVLTPAADVDDEAVADAAAVEELSPMMGAPATVEACSTDCACTKPGVGVVDGVADADGVAVGVTDAEGVAVGVGVDDAGVGVGVGEPDGDGVGVGVGVADEDGVGVGVGVAVGVAVGVGVRVAVAVGVGVGVAVGVAVTVGDWDELGVGVGVGVVDGVADGLAALATTARSATSVASVVKGVADMGRRGRGRVVWWTGRFQELEKPTRRLHSHPTLVNPCLLFHFPAVTDKEYSHNAAAPSSLVAYGAGLARAQSS